MSMAKAVWRDCPGLREGKYAHTLRDYCTSCAPFWERFPVCPTCRSRLQKRGRQKCPGCEQFVKVEEDKG